MSKRYFQKSLLLFAVCFTLLTVYFVRGDLTDWFLANFSPWTVSGTVTDITNGSPLDLAEIYVDGGKTYSIYNGTFKLGNVHRLGEVFIVSPDLYEDYSKPVDCQRTPSGQVAPRKAICNIALYPTAENVAVRVEINLTVVRPETDLELQNRNAALWDLMEPESRKALGSRAAFIDTMVIHNLILKKMKQQELTFKMEMAKARRLEVWQDPLSGNRYTDVAEIPVFRTYASGKTLTVSDRFARVGGIWRYIPDFRLADIRSFDSTYGWVLKLKE